MNKESRIIEKVFVNGLLQHFSNDYAVKKGQVIFRDKPKKGDTVTLICRIDKKY